MTYEQLKAHQRSIGQWPLSKEAVYNLAIAECARAIGMSEKSLIALMNKGESK